MYGLLKRFIKISTLHIQVKKNIPSSIPISLAIYFDFMITDVLYHWRRLSRFFYFHFFCIPKPFFLSREMTILMSFIRTDRLGSAIFLYNIFSSPSLPPNVIFFYADGSITPRRFILISWGCLDVPCTLCRGYTGHRIGNCRETGPGALEHETQFHFSFGFGVFTQAA